MKFIAKYYNWISIAILVFVIFTAANNAYRNHELNVLDNELSKSLNKLMDVNIKQEQYIDRQTKVINKLLEKLNNNG